MRRFCWKILSFLQHRSSYLFVPPSIIVMINIRIFEAVSIFSRLFSLSIQQTPVILSTSFVPTQLRATASSFNPHPQRAKPLNHIAPEWKPDSSSEPREQVIEDPISAGTIVVEDGLVLGRGSFGIVVKAIALSETHSKPIVLKFSRDEVDSKAIDREITIFKDYINKEC